LEPRAINYPALLLEQITLPPYSQNLVEVISQLPNGQNLMFEPSGNFTSKFIFIPNTLFNVQQSKAKILLINAQNRQQTLSKNTRMGTISYDKTLFIHTITTTSTIHHSTQKYIVN